MIRLQKYLYEIPLCHTAEPRTGLLLQLTNKEGSASWGEIAPLPGWSKETLSEAVHQLDQVWPVIAKASDPLKALESLPLLPSAAFGLEMAFTPPALSPILICGLLMGSKEDILKRAVVLKEKGVKTVKLKIGALSPQDAFSLIQELQPFFRLRIELNKSWPLEQGLEFFSSFPHDAFDYLEEPAPTLSTLKLFSHPFALDETLRETNDREFLTFPSLKTFVVKPTLTGSSSTWLAFKKWNKQIVLSSAFESGLAISHIATLAARFLPSEIAMGLDTYSYLLEDILDSKLYIAEGKLHFPKELFPSSLRLKKI